MDITFNDARTALHEVVAAAGEHHVYTPPKDELKCVNVSNGAPHCLVAKVLQHLGVDVVGFCRANPGYIGAGVNTLLDAMGGRHTVDWQARRYLVHAQAKQDRKVPRGPGISRTPWGEVRDDADHLAREQGWLS